MNGQPKPALRHRRIHRRARIAIIAATCSRAAESECRQDRSLNFANAEHPDPGPDPWRRAASSARARSGARSGRRGSHKALDKTDNMVRSALNVWAGWGPIIWRTTASPAHAWKTSDGKEFKVELGDRRSCQDGRRLCRPVRHIGWGTLI